MVKVFWEDNQCQTLLGVTGSGKTSENAVEYFVSYYGFKLLSVLNCPFCPDNPEGLDEITQDGQDNRKWICDLDSCNEEMLIMQW